MAEPLTDLDIVLLNRWADTTGIREAIKELEGRLGDRFEALAERLRPWLDARGFTLFGVERKRASIDVGKSCWTKRRDTPLIHVRVADVLPFGYRRVDEEHPYVWLLAEGLKDNEQLAFRAELTTRLRGRPEGWINEDCDDSWPVGRYIESHGDPERVQLAQSDEAMEAFIKAALEPMFAISTEIDAALGIAASSVGAKV